MGLGPQPHLTGEAAGATGAESPSVWNGADICWPLEGQWGGPWPSAPGLRWGSLWHRVVGRAEPWSPRLHGDARGHLAGCWEDLVGKCGPGTVPASHLAP